MSSPSPSLTPTKSHWATGWWRYFPFETRSWRKIVADSCLSSEAKEIVNRVVSQSGLMRFEKLEVVHELIAHFADGNSAGRSYPQLIADFGDPQVTAKLIRRSKMRNRPIMFKILGIMGWCLLALVSIYVVFASYFHMGKPVPTVDYLAKFNDGIAEADEDDLAWPIYRPLWTKYGFSEGGKFSTDDLFVLEEENGVIRYRDLKRPTDAGWDDAVRRLEEIADLLEGFRQARFKSRFGVPQYADRTRYSREDFAALFPNQEIDDPSFAFNPETVSDEVQAIMADSALHVLLPHCQVMRTAARIFTVDTRLAIEQDDRQRVIVNLETMFGLARQAADTNTLVGSLVGFAIGSMGFDLVEEVLTQHPEFLADEHLAQIQNAVEQEDISAWMKLCGERAFLLDTIQRVYTDDGNGDGRITSTGIQVLSQLGNSYYESMSFPENPKALQVAMYAAEPASLFVVASRKETTELTEQFLDQFEAKIARPNWEQAADEIDVEEFLEANRYRHAVLSMLLPAIDQVHQALVRTVARQDGVIAAVACQRYFLKHNRWPDRFDDVSPEFVTEFPLDHMNGQFLNIKAEDNGVLIYSVGHDLDDDGGVMHVDLIRHHHRRSGPHVWVGGASNPQDFDADWILWPQLDWESRLPAEDE